MASEVILLRNKCWRRTKQYAFAAGAQGDLDKPLIVRSGRDPKRDKIVSSDNDLI